MSIIGNDFWLYPGMGASKDTSEAAVQWNKGQFMVFSASETIDGSSTDAGNTPTTILRPGLALGRVTSTSKLKPYNPSATDGTQIFYGYVPWPLKMVDFDGNNADRSLSVIIGGYIKTAGLPSGTGNGTDNKQIRMQARGRFWYDDYATTPFVAPFFFPNMEQVSKTANYQVLGTDNGTLFDNTGATGAVTFTLPAIAAGLYYQFLVVANQTVTVASTEGTNMIIANNASANSVAFSTSSQKIGGIFKIYTNPAASKWIVEAPTSNTVTPG